jgi:hypothetical protein
MSWSELLHVWSDADGTSHAEITRASQVVNVFLTPPPGFDVRRWARGEA